MLRKLSLFLFFFMSFRPLMAQQVERIEWDECHSNEPLDRMNNRIADVDVVNDSIQVYTLQGLSNCCMKDLKRDSIASKVLFIEVEDKTTNEICLCSCFFIIKITTKHIQEIDTISFNGTNFVKSNAKYLPEEYEYKGEKPALIYDAEGYHYINQYDEKGRLKRSFKTKGSYAAYLYYNRRGQVKKTIVKHD